MHRSNQWHSHQQPAQYTQGQVGGGYQQSPHYQNRGPQRPKRFGTKCGLFGYNAYNHRHFAIPLKNVAINAKVVDFFARVEVTQEYVNNDRNPVEVSYTFPIAARSAVCSFSAEVEGRKIAGEIKENEEAANLYDDAISSGHGAFAGRSERPNVFTAVVGNLPPGKQATIRIAYVTELGLERGSVKDAQAHKLKFSLPSRFAPKYSQKNAQGHNATSSSFYHQQQQHQQQHPDFKLTIDVEFVLSSRIAGLAASQPVSISLPTASHAKVALGSMVNALKHDFTLLVTLGDRAHPSGAFSYGLLEVPPETTDADGADDRGEYAAALVLYPKELFPSAAADKATPEEDETEEEEEDDDGDEDEGGGGGGGEEEHVGAPVAAQGTKAGPEASRKDAVAKKKPADKREKPSITDLRLDWGDLPAADRIKSTAIPTSIFFSHGVLFLYSLLPRDALAATESGGEGDHACRFVKVTLRGKMGGQEVSHDLFIDATAPQRGALVHQLYARSAIRALERAVEGKADEAAKKEIIDLSLRYSLSSRYTTFVAIEERQEATEGTMVRRTVPLNGFGYRQPTTGAVGGGGGGTRGGRGRGGGGGFGRGGGVDGERSFYGHDRRDQRGGRGSRDHGYNLSEEGGSGWRGGRNDRWGDGAAQASPAGGGGYRKQGAGAPPYHKKLEITEEITDQLVGLKGNEKDYWLLNSALAKLLDKTLTQVVDALVGVPIVDYISNVWATSLAIAVLSHSAQKDKHAEVLKRAEAWLEEETKKYFLDEKDKWLAKATALLHL